METLGCIKTGEICFTKIDFKTVFQWRFLHKKFTLTSTSSLKHIKLKNETINLKF